MLFNSVPSSTLYVKVNFKRTPYSNTVTALRVVAHTFAEFTANKALFLVDLVPEDATLAEVNSVVESLRIRANALNVKVSMPNAVYNKLAERE
jgi:hypothetical protein